MRTAGLGLLIELAPDDIRGLRDIRAGVRDELGPGWSVGYLFPAPRTADLGRFFLARGDVPASPAYPLSALAYDDYFPAPTNKRLVVVLTDGESRPFSVRQTAKAFPRKLYRVLVVRLWRGSERVWHIDGSPEE